VYWNVTHNIEYLQNPVTLVETAVRANHLVLPFLIGTSVLWIGWLRSTRLMSRYWQTLVAGLVVASIFAAGLGLRFFPHYFVQLYVPLTIAAAPWVASIMTWPLLAPGWIVATATAVAVMGWTTVNAARATSVTTPALSRESVQVANWLRADACYERASLFVWGSSPQFYYHAKLPPASQYFFPEFPLVHYYAGNPGATRAHGKRRRNAGRTRHWRRLMADLDRSQPAYILDTTASGGGRWQDFPIRNYPVLDRFIHQRYTSVATVDGVEILRRNGCADISVDADSPQRRVPSRQPDR
jgi:hypothetical protein